MNKHIMCMPEFESVLGNVIEDFISEKMACGYRYGTAAQLLRRFDRFLVESDWKTRALPKALIENWTKRREHESVLTHRNRFNITRQLLEFMRNRGLDVFVPDTRFVPIVRRAFAPYIYSQEEMRRLIQAADQLRPFPSSPERHIVLPEVFRLLYGCGLRAGEALGLTLADTDLDQGILTIRDAKFGKNRLVPIDPALTARLKCMRKRLGNRSPRAFLFPARNQERYAVSSISCVFRGLLNKSGIPYQGRRKGPRLHDLRHTFAVHRMTMWYEGGIDLGAMLPILATYMGHQSLLSTQKYLHLTIQLIADMADRLDGRFGDVIPGRNDR